MAQMPVPISSAPQPKRLHPSRGPPAIQRAQPEVKMATPSDTKVVVMLYRRVMGSDMAIMPMKCMDQMPTPMATAPPISQNRTCRALEAATRAASDSAVYDTSTATTMDRVTNHEL